MDWPTPLTRNMRWAGVPKRALTISRKVLAPLAFRLTAEAMTEKKMMETLQESLSTIHNKVMDKTYVPQTPYHQPPETPNWYTTSDETMRVALHVHAETFKSYELQPRQQRQDNSRCQSRRDRASHSCLRLRTPHLNRTILADDADGD